MIFAGAGVSMGPPANYPDFNGLVDKIAEGTTHKREDHEPIDRFLGRLQHDGVHVHELAKSFLSNPKSKPNPLHKHLVGLFRCRAAVRLVTTNFDRHFSSVIESVFGESLEVHAAPALPVGSNWNGLVYIHGSVDGPAERLILTDGDFGRAYLTDGWARRFLLGLYSEFVVLFVGYSHDDIVMQYLARGLPPNHTELFALTTEDKEDQWRFLGITPISYRRRRGKDKHGAVREAIGAWARYTSMGALDHERRVKRLLADPPPLPHTEDDDYLLGVVEHEDRIGFFVDSAQDPVWLLWAEARGLLDDLFQPIPRRADTDRLRKLERWYSYFVLCHPEIALDVFRQQKQSLTPSLWSAIALGLHSDKTPNPDSVKSWLPILMNQQTAAVNKDLINYQFEKAMTCGSWSLLLLLFEHLTRPQVRLKEGRPAYKVVIHGEQHWLDMALQNLVRPNLDKIGEDIVRIASYNIRLAHTINLNYGIASNQFDGQSFRRAAIERHKQNQLRQDFDPLIDVCRDGIERLLEIKPATAIALIDDWVESEAPLLRRLAVYGMMKNRRKSTSRKLTWVVKHELMGSLAVHHELFQLLKAAYPSADRDSRKELLNEAKRVTRREINDDKRKDPDRYWRRLLRVYDWLDEAAEGRCQLVRQRLQRLRKRYPRAKRSEYPDFLHWVGEEKYGFDSPKKAADLLGMSLPDVANLVLSFKDEKPDGVTREGLLHELAEAVKQDADWGVSLCKEILRKRPSGNDFWWHIYWGWIQAELTEKQWGTVLSLIDGNRALTKQVDGLAQLLERGVATNDHGIPKRLLAQAEQIAERAWRHVSASRAEDDSVDSDDWVTTSINHPGGNLAQFFLVLLSMKRKDAGIEWKVIPKRLREQLDRMVSDNSYAGEMARVVIAGRLQFLFALDQAWTRAKAVPLFSWRGRGRQAAQAWHGFLFWGRWQDGLMRHLLSRYQQCFGRLDSDLRPVRGRFVEHVVSICLFSSIRRVRGSWINEFLSVVQPEDREAFAKSVTKLLREIGPERSATAWGDWLRDYWDGRLLGKPVPLTPAETCGMVSWAPHLGSAYPEVVSRIKSSPLGTTIDEFVYHSMAENEVAKNYPRETSELLVVLVEASYKSVQDYGGLRKIIEELVKTESTHGILRSALEQMVLKGSRIAREFLQQIGDHGEEGESE